MTSMSDILTRADIPALETLIGRPAVKLLALLDSQLIRGDELRRLLFNLHHPAELLIIKKSWQEIVDLLKQPEAEELANLLAADSSNDPWGALKRLKFRRGGKKHEIACAFFGVTIPQEELCEAPVKGHHLLRC